MEASKPEYQHFIPQFLLKNFSHPFRLPNRPRGRKSKKRNGSKKIYLGEQVINSICLFDRFVLDECPVRRVGGLYNMYVDKTKPLKDQRNLEEKFGKLECSAGSIFRKIVSAFELGKSAICLNRVDNYVLRKFLFLLIYRGKQFYQKYNIGDINSYNGDDKELLRDYMNLRGFTEPIDAWLQSLETIIDMEMDIEGHWQFYIRREIYPPIADLFIEHLRNMYLAICTPENHEEEFILTENSYNVWEGPSTHYSDEGTSKRILMSPRFHRFAPVSPRLMIVLRSNLLPEPIEDADPDIKYIRQYRRQLMTDTCNCARSASLLEELPIRKATNYYAEMVSGRLIMKPGLNNLPDKNDTYSFSFFKISTRYVRIINGLLLDHAFHGSRIIFNRKEALLDLLEWFLTQPCEVGKSIAGEHAGEQMKYLNGLAHLMMHEGRVVSLIVGTRPTQRNSELEESRLESLDGARAENDIMRNEIRERDGSFHFETIYAKLGGGKTTLRWDMAASHSMLHTWAKTVDMDCDSPDYESICRSRLHSLLERYQGKKGCAVFWLFLKRIRLSLSLQTKGMERLPPCSVFNDGDCAGPEDLLVYAYPMVQEYELNKAMFKAFNGDITQSRGARRGIETMGYSMLFNDDQWKISTLPVQEWLYDDLVKEMAAERRNADNVQPHKSAFRVLTEFIIGIVVRILVLLGVLLGLLFMVLLVLLISGGMTVVTISHI